MRKPFVLFDNSRPGRERLRIFADPVEIVTARDCDVAPALAGWRGELVEGSRREHLHPGDPGR